MSDDHNSKASPDGEAPRGFLATLLIGLVRDAVQLVVAFAVGTGASAVACWYYGIPLGFSMLGGILVLGLALALSTHSLFS